MIHTVAESDEILRRLEPSGIRLGLGPFRCLLRNLGDPHRQARIVLVGGTNGKGSVAAALAAASECAGSTSGLYTSPHLEEPRERIRVGGRAVDDRLLATLLAEVLASADEEPTYFEALTAAAFLAFERADVDLWVLEVGLGGRLDATNAVEPLVSVVTPVAVDHGEILGYTPGEIAREKAGIFRRGRPCVYWAGNRETAEVLGEEIGAVGGLPVPVTGLSGRPSAARPGEWLVEVGSGGTVAVSGEHRAANAALAVAAARALTRSGLPLGDRAVAAGLRRLRWPGRLEVVGIPGGRQVIFDGAHNPAAARALAPCLPPAYGLVFGAFADKDVSEMLAALIPGASWVILTGFDHPRAGSPESFDPSQTISVATRRVPSLGEALDLALAEKEGGPVVVTGSLALVGEARGALRSRFGTPAPAAEIDLV